MRLHLVLLALVGLVCGSTHPAWKDNTEYLYFVNGRTFTSLHELSDQYSGIFLKAKLYIIPRPDGKLQAKIADAKYAEIHTQMPNGWNTNIPESQLSYKQFNLSGNPFQILLQEGVIQGLIVEKGTSNWEVNILKSIVSQFQLDIKGRNIIRSPINILPQGDKLEGIFKTMEETVTGRTETSYEMHRLPEYLMQSKPWIVPLLRLKGDGDIVEIIKSKNYTNSEERPAYHYGFGTMKEGEPTSNMVGRFFSRNSNSRIILTGKASRFTIQCAETVNKIIVNPTLNAKEQGSVISALNVTLREVKTNNEPAQELVNPIEIGSLIYTYESPFSTSNEALPWKAQKSWRARRDIMGNILIKDEGHQSSSNSEEQIMQQHQTRPSMTDAPESPLLPYYMGFYGRSIKVNPEFDLKQNVKRITKEISEDLQEPQKIQNHSTLSKYVMLCSLIRLMNDKEIESVADEIYTQSKQGQERLVWEVYRDAVSEGGTGPSFLNIQKWIVSRKIEKEEAAAVVNAMANSVRFPTEEYIRHFYELLQRPEVYNEKYLNETSLLSFTELVYRVYVNKNESLNQYPVHSFGNFNSKEGRDFVKSTVIPYLTENLHKAVSQTDSRKIHVYIRALGNTGHKKVLKSFEPYLEGDKQASQFQRMLMVFCMDNLLRSYPEIARAVLYRIYQNIAEIPEIRSVAAYQLMVTRPPVEMIQRMAENTNFDPQEQVNAVTKSLIEGICRLESKEYQYVRQACEAARPLLVKKEYGKHLSFQYIHEFISKNLQTECQHSYFQVGSTDSYFPKGIKYEVRSNDNNMVNHLFHFEGMISSIEELMNVLYKQTSKEKMYQESRNKYSEESRWSPDKLAESLNLKTNEREQLEGFIYTNTRLIQKLWSFDNKTVELFPEMIREREEMLRKGKEFTYTKLRHLKEMALSVPTEMGLPFLYTYDMPMLARFEGKLRTVATPEISRNGKLNVPEKISADLDVFVTMSGKVESHLSVVTPFDTKIYIAGFDKSAQIHLPIKVKMEVDIKKQETEMEFIVQENHKDARLLQYSSWPFTSSSDIMSVTPIALRSTTHLIRPLNNTHNSFDFVWGFNETGISYRVWGHHPQQSRNLVGILQMIQTGEFSSLWKTVWDNGSLQQTEANIALIPAETTTRKVIVRMKHQRQYLKVPDRQTQEKSWSIEQLSSKLNQNTEQRQKDLTMYVSSGIHNARVHSIDASLEFQGDMTYKHMLYFSGAKSNIGPHSRLVVFYKRESQKQSETAIQIKGYVPNTNGLDLTESLKVSPKAKYEVILNHKQGEQDGMKVKATADFERSDTRKERIENQPLYKVCKKQMQEGNRQLSACQNMTIEANYYDDIKIELQHKNVHKNYSDFLENVFKGIQLFYYPMTEIRTIDPQDKGKISVRVQFLPENLRFVNFTVKSQDKETKMFNLSMNEMTKVFLVSHPVFHLRSRVHGHIMRQENIRPTCVFDKTAAQTFSRWTYPLSLGNKWTLALQYIPQQARFKGVSRVEPIEQLKNQIENLAVLVRELPSEQREVKIMLTHPESKGKPVEIDMKPKEKGDFPSASVLFDGQEVHFNETQGADKYNGLIEVYSLPNGEVKMEIKDWLYAIFDGQRLKLTATSDKVRDAIVGLCGRFSQDIYEDMWSPDNCIMRSPQKFVQSFVIEGEKVHETMHNSRECVPKMMPLYADVISDYDVERKGSRQQFTTFGTTMKTRYVEQNGDICFTTRPVPVCLGSSRQTTMSKDVPVHCITKTKTAFYLKNQIDQGGNPDFSHKPVTKTIKMEIPQQC